MGDDKEESDDNSKQENVKSYRMGMKDQPTMKVRIKKI